jgi:aminopeptidase N
MLPDNMERATNNMKRVPLAVATAVAVVLLAMAGCSKKESQEAPLPPPSVTTLPATQPLPALPPPATTSAAAAALVSAADTNQASGDDQTQAELAAQVKQLENEYQNTPDFQKRVTLIYELSSNDDGADVIDALAHLFLNEKDQELKIELVNSLTDVDGQNDKKLAILSTGMRGDQPKEVRLEAIDGMGDVEDKRGIQILQGFLNDPDEDIKQAVQDTIEQLQDVPEPSSQPTQSQITGHVSQ